MRTCIALGLALCIFCAGTIGAVNTAPVIDNTAVTALTVGDIVDMKAKDFAAFTGQKMSLKERVGYTLVKSKLKKELRKGNLKADDSFDKAAASGNFNIGAFLLGFILGLIGFLIVILAFNDKNAWKSALIGWGIWLVLLVVLVLA